MLFVESDNISTLYVRNLMIWGQNCQSFEKELSNQFLEGASREQLLLYGYYFLLSQLMGSSTSRIEDKKSFSIILPGTEDLEKGSVGMDLLVDRKGAIHRHPDAANGLEKSYDPNVNTLYENFLCVLFVEVTCRHAHDLNPEANFVGWRPIVNGEAQPYTFYTSRILVCSHY